MLLQVQIRDHKISNIIHMLLQVQIRDQVIRTHVSDEMRREIQKALEDKLKKREKALQAEFRDEITGMHMELSTCAACIAHTNFC